MQLYNLFLDIDYDFFWEGGGGVMGPGNKAVKVKESDCEKMVSANLPFFTDIKPFTNEIWENCSFFYHCTKEYKRNRGPVALVNSLKFPIIKFLISIITINFV